MIRQITNILVCLGLGVFASACDIDQTREGELPEVDVRGGQLPEYDVDIETRTETIEVPDIDVPDIDVDVDREQRTVDVPDVDVDTHDEPRE